MVQWIYTSGNLGLLKTVTTGTPIMMGSFHGNLSESSWPLNSPESSFVGNVVVVVVVVLRGSKIVIVE